MPKVFAIYPTDKQHPINFLNRINTYSKRELLADWHCRRVKFRQVEHDDCIKDASESEARFILFMGHGRSDCLFGSCAKYSSEFASPDAMEHSEDHYKNDDFINGSNIELFKDKIFFSFSCNSNRNKKDSLGRIAIEKGVKCFVGFGDIPTDYSADDYFPKKAIAIFKGIITKIIKQSLVVAVENKYSVQKLVDFIKMLTLKEIQSLILSKHKCRHKKIIVKNLYFFKSEILILGDRFEKVC